MNDFSSVAPPQGQDFSHSSAFAAAVQRAQQIAAKMNPGSVKNNQDPTKKRLLEDCAEPDAKKIAPNIPDSTMNLRGSATATASMGDSPIPRPSGPTTPYGGIANEEIRVPDSMVGLIIGRGGEQITRLQGETGCKIQMATECGPDSNRTCTITGTKDAVNRAKELVQSIVNNQRTKSDDQIPGANPPYPGPTGPAASAILSGLPGYQEIMVPGPKVGLIIGKGGETIKQLQEKSGAKMVVIQEGPGIESEKPLRITGDPQKVEHAKKLVYELLAEKEMQIYNRGSRNPNFSGNNQGGGDESEVFVPKNAVGIVIGKGGEMVKKIQTETGAKLQFIPIDGQDGSHGDRKVVITGSSDSIETARMRIQDLVESAKRNQRPNFTSNRTTEYGGGSIGGGGSGSGGGGGGGVWNNRDMGNKIEFQYTVPANKCGIVIGKGGETIKQINQQTGAHCELDRRNPGNDIEKYFLIKGTPEQVEYAKRVFAEKLGGGMNPATNMYGQNQIGYTTSWNAGFQAWPGQGDPNASQPASVQINPVTGQPDYSTQWAEYYRSMGRHMEADMIEQQAKQQQQQALSTKTDGGQPQGTNPPNPASITPAQHATSQIQSQQQQQQQQHQQPQQQQQQQQSHQNGGGADYSAQWAEYYRSVGKIKEAEAIEAQMKSGKPSGVASANQMSQSQTQQHTMQPNPMANQAGTTGVAPNAFPQAYGGYPGMNPASGGYYTPQAQVSGQPGQQNPAFSTSSYQNYQFPQASTDN